MIYNYKEETNMAQPTTYDYTLNLSVSFYGSLPKEYVEIFAKKARAALSDLLDSAPEAIVESYDRVEMELKSAEASE